MPANFDFLINKKEYTLFSEACIKTERILSTSLTMCILGSYEALELAVRWVYSVENISSRDKYKTLEEFISDPLFVSLVDKKVYLKLPYIIKLWKYTLESDDNLTKDDGVLALSILFEFVTWIDYTYGLEYFPRELKEEDIPVDIITSINEEMALENRSILQKNREEIKKFQDQVTSVGQYFVSKKVTNRETRKFVPNDFDTMSVREYYIDLDLKFAGWDLEIDVKKGIQYTIGNMVDGKEKIAIDYVLLGKDGLPLAIIEGKYSLEDFEYGRKRALKYAAHIGNDMRRIPVVFLLHGGNYYYLENLNSTPRMISGIFNIEDLHRIRNQVKSKKNLVTVSADPRITNYTYQIEAAKAVIHDIGENKRKSIVFISSGLGKTRILAGVIDLMSRANYISSVLYLTGRKTNLKYVKKMLKNLIVGMSVGEYSEELDENTRLVISTTESIMKEIGNISGSGEKYFSPGQFDLIVVDEVYRNTVVAYKKIFDYFDSLVVGISPLPQSDIDSKISEFFNLKQDENSYIYHYEEALQKEKIIVPYNVVNIPNRLFENEMFYDQLSTENKNHCEETYTDDKSKMLNWVPSVMNNNYLMSVHTIDLALEDIMKVGIISSKDECIGKTILFAQNKNHAELILQRFRMKFTEFASDFAKIAYCDDNNAVDDFVDPEKKVNLLIDVGFATAGLDLPEVVNVVLFKKIYSKYEFYQMVNIGNRSCKNITLVDSKEGLYIGKKRYYVFDYLGNFDFFNEEKNHTDGLEIKNVSEEIFSRCVEIVYSIQKESLIDRESHNFSEKIINFLIEQVKKAGKEFDNVHFQLSNIERYYRKNTYFPALKEEDKKILITQVAPLIEIDGSDEHALQFDNFMYGLILAQLEGTAFVIKAKRQLVNICNMLKKNEHIDPIRKEKEFIEYYGSRKFLDNSTIVDLENLRMKIRTLMKYVFEIISETADENTQKTTLEKMETDLNASNEDVLEEMEKEIEKDDGVDNIREYKEKVTRWIKSKLLLSAIYKLRNNMPLLPQDYKDLEKAFTKTLGTKKEYESAYGNLPYGLLVRETIPLERESVKVAFFNVNTDKTLNEEQKAFISKMMEYIINHGYMDELKLVNGEIEGFDKFEDIFDNEREKKIIKILREIKGNASSY
ncbi:DEAD/DEAH box helicase family protein [Fusobacterium sp. PH5-44]|uniref:DEAD/DEAH box helicase family protein n=1 Tax=unclassified Fusobacterium TaxID=2648384 RepID=UPI003D212F2E